MQPSPYQQAIYDFVTSGQGSATINAVAGSGKTTTIIEAAKRLPALTPALMLAFNRSITDELRPRVPGLVTASTFHSAAFATFPKGTKVFAGKVSVIAKATIPPAEHGAYLSFCKTLVARAKASGVGLYGESIAPERFEPIAEYHDLSPDKLDASPQRGYEYAAAIYDTSLRKREEVDFDDMLLHPLFYNHSIPQQQWLFVDEAQDLSEIQHQLLSRMVPSGRLIAVGDPYQAIYGFRGATSDSMNYLSERFHATTFPLSVSYRCSQRVVEEAQEFCPIIEPWMGAPMGTVRDLGTDWETMDFRDGDAILCRLTRPLIRLAWKLISGRTPCYVLGRDLADGLIALIKKCQQPTLDSTLKAMEAYVDAECTRFDLLEQFSKAAALRDKFDAIQELCDGLTLPQQLITRIENLFEPKPGAIVLSTVHKAKGLEWPRVYILGRHQYMPSKFAKLLWQQQQERNIIYVAITRAKTELYYIEERN
jgi:DNA helicase-2/ATP-dependent DNA helicase PcrA